MRTSIIVSAIIGLATAKPVLRGRQIPADFGPFTFTSTYTLVATPDRVVNGTPAVPAPGEAGSQGTFNYGINSQLNMICYNITLTGVTGPYLSPAITATHIHEAAEGANGPPRIAFPNPEPADSGPEVVKRSQGCIQGPFTTGINGPDGQDTGTGFTVAQIEANPAGFFTDSHTAVSVPGVVRVQMLANAPGVQPGVPAVQPAPGQVINPADPAAAVPAPAASASPAAGVAAPAPAPVVGAQQPAQPAPIGGLDACEGIANVGTAGAGITGCNKLKVKA